MTKTSTDSISIKTWSVNTPPVTAHRDTSEIMQITTEVQVKNQPTESKPGYIFIIMESSISFQYAHCCDAMW